MKLSQVGVQLYTVRDHLKDPSTFASTIDRLKGFGYRAVELIHSETVSDQQIAQICGSAGVAVAAAHIPGEVILERPDSVVEKRCNTAQDFVKCRCHFFRSADSTTSPASATSLTDGNRL